MEKTEIILIIPPPFFIKMPHIGVAYLAANLRRNGFTVSVYDLSLKLYNNAKAEFRRFWQIDCVNSYFQSEIAEMVFNNFEGEIDEFIEDIDKSCTLVFTSQKNNIALIEQSGVYLTITFNDKSKTIMHGELKNGKMIFEKVFASNNKLNNPCGAETLTELTIELIKKDGMPDQLLGTWKNPECGECAVIQFSAVKQQAEG